MQPVMEELSLEDMLKKGHFVLVVNTSKENYRQESSWLQDSFARGSEPLVRRQELPP